MPRNVVLWTEADVERQRQFNRRINEPHSGSQISPAVRGWSLPTLAEVTETIVDGASGTANLMRGPMTGPAAISPADAITFWNLTGHEVNNGDMIAVERIRLPYSDGAGWVARSPVADFGTPIVPRTTITAATRTVVAGSDTFTPGVGTAFLFKVGAGGDLEPRLDKLGAVEWATVYNLTDLAYAPNAAQAPLLEAQDGSTFQMQDGSNFELQRTSTATDYIGPGTAVQMATMDRSGELVIERSPSTAQVRVDRAMVSESDGIAPDGCGEVWLFVDQALDATAQGGAAGTITLASTAESATNGFYNDWVVRLISGKGKGQSRWIKSYTAATRVADIGAFGDVTHNWDVAPDATTVYKLERLQIVIGHWNHAQSGRVLFQHEEVVVQPMARQSGHYDIIRGADKTLLRAVVQETGGIAPGSQGQILLSDSEITTTGLWDFGHADKYIERLGQAYVQYEKTIPVGGPSIDEGRIYRIVGPDCSALTDSPP